MELFGYFEREQLYLLCGAGISAAVSIALFGRRPKLSLCFLGLTALFTFLFAAILDPYLNLWDERFHALVARNLSRHPFMPTLYDDPVLGVKYDAWWNAHIWLYKQPYFLWLMALSHKIFGPSELALRLPGLIHGVAGVLITYRCGELLVNRRTGFMAAFLLITSVYMIDLVAGRQSLDQNDLMFFCYISLSIWAFLEYQASGKKKWIYLIGLFAGLAILIKWLVGLLVYFGWFVLKLQQRHFRPGHYRDLLTALAITVTIALPWQVYCLLRFPDSLQAAYSLNALHFTETLDGQSGNFWYHFMKFDILYGFSARIFILPALVMAFILAKDRKLLISMVSMVVVSYLFFSIAKTKMPSFVFINAMTIFILLATLADYLLRAFGERLPGKFPKFLLFLAAMALLILVRFNLPDIAKRHSLMFPDHHYAAGLKHNKEMFQTLNLPPDAVLFNIPGKHYVEAMYYTGLPAYEKLPTQQQLKDLRSKGRSIGIFRMGQQLPYYLESDSAIKIIDEKIEVLK